MSVYESRELAREARRDFREAICWACPPEDASTIPQAILRRERARGRRFEGWRVRVVSGDGCAVIGYGKCARGHEVQAACAI